jgi:hypothetical protein
MNVLQQIAQQDRKAFLSVRREFQKECRKHGEDFIQIPIGEAKDLTCMGKAPEACFRNRSFFVMLFMDDSDGTPYLRMSVNRTELDNDGGFKGGMTWDELMAVKRGIGFADLWMTEVYPPDEDIVNVANIRHLFLVNQPPYAWSKKPPVAKLARQESILGKILSRFRKP